MKQSWVVGVISLYLFVMLCHLFIAQQMSYDGTLWTGMKDLYTPTMINFSGSETALSTVMKGVGSYLVIFIEFLFNYSPIIWTGNLFYIYLLIILPINIGMIFAIMTIVRGTGSS